MVISVLLFWGLVREKDPTNVSPVVSTCINRWRFLFHCILLRKKTLQMSVLWWVLVSIDGAFSFTVLRRKSLQMSVLWWVLVSIDGAFSFTVLRRKSLYMPVLWWVLVSIDGAFCYTVLKIDTGERPYKCQFCGLVLVSIEGDHLMSTPW